jgi:hypothetical protein
MTGLLEAIAAVVLVFAIAYGSVAGVIVLAVMAPKVWKRVRRRRAFPKAALQRNWPQLPARLRVRQVPSRFPDGKPLTVPEQERMDVIEQGYGPAPKVLRRMR